MFTAQNGGPYGLGAAVAQLDGSLIVMKRGQNVGYQSYLILLPGEGAGMVVMTNSDNGSILAEALIRKTAELQAWPRLAFRPLPIKAETIARRFARPVGGAVHSIRSGNPDTPAKGLAFPIRI